MNRKMGGQLVELELGGAIPIVKDPPPKKKTSRLEMLRNLNGKVMSK